MYKKKWNKIEAVVFDYDGTLRPINMRKIYDAHLEIYKFLGILPNEHYTSFETYTMWKGVPDEFFGKNMDTRIKSQKIFHKHYNDFVPLFSWAECIVKEISKRHKIAILSNNVREAIDRQLGNLADYFEIIVGSESVDNMKPHPEGLIRISNELQISLKNILLIGDTMTDYTTAKNAGTMIGFVCWGMDDLNNLLAYNSDYVFETPMRIISDLI